MNDKDTNYVERQADAADDEDHDGVLDLRYIDESLEGLEEDRKREREEEDTVDQGRQNLCSMPPVGIPRVDLACIGHLWGDLRGCGKGHKL